MKKIICITLLFVLFAGVIFAADLLAVNKSTIYKVEKDALWTTTMNQLQVITKHCVTRTTRIYLDNKPVGLSQLKPGLRVVIQFRTDPCNTAILIKAYSR